MERAEINYRNAIPFVMMLVVFSILTIVIRPANSTTLTTSSSGTQLQVAYKKNLTFDTSSPEAHARSLKNMTVDMTSKEKLKFENLILGIYGIAIMGAERHNLTMMEAKLGVDISLHGKTAKEIFNLIDNL